mmetsp:Transcript_68421/g.164258  ORF Transcript_68421/g.164258 Transcript_68421/m.164258 type:complete len:347 (+) Transcript_68421:116-1156(+)
MSMMEASGMLSSTSTMKKAFLTSKFQVGSAKSDRINFSLAQKVFHSGDAPREVLESKRAVQKSKQSNVLGIDKQSWNQSTLVDLKDKDGSKKDLKRQLLNVRAGLMDQKDLVPSKQHHPDAILERQKFIVGITGQGPIGKLTGKWINAVDERGLCNHCIEKDWPDWNHSNATHTKEDKRQADDSQAARYGRQKKLLEREPKLELQGYTGPKDSVANINDRLRERKIDFQDLKDQFKQELKEDFPHASEERLQAMAQRLLNEKLLVDEKAARFPVQHEHFRPNVSLTTQNRRYKVYHHPGSWGWNEREKMHCWSCCMNFSQDSPGCEHKIVNPDAWSVVGFERYSGS